MCSAIQPTIRSGRLRARRSKSFWSCTITRPIANRACRRSGTPRSPATPCSRSAASAPARCLSMLAQLGETADTNPAVARAVEYLHRTQLPEGSWFGRWGMNYIYGTWSVLCALNAAGVDHGSLQLRKAIAWLVSIQNADGGWGEDGSSYKLDYRGYERAPSTASQTAWALMGLMAAGEVNHPAVARGIAYLVRTQGQDGLWVEQHYTAVGFPRIFYLRYHGYPKFFPLWALARYRNLRSANSTTVAYGM